MVVPLAARVVAAVFGALLILSAARSMITTIIVPRPASGWLTRCVDWVVNRAFQVGTAPVGRRLHDLKNPSAGIITYRRRDRILAGQAPAILLAQLIAWLAIFFVGFALLMWPFLHAGITTAFTTVGPGLWFIGDVHLTGAGERTVEDMAAVTGLITITLQIAYLPTLYAAFNRRETDIALLNARAGVPSWGPELLARTHYALGSGASTVDTLPDLYAQWERFGADIAESHTTYLPLVRFRSPRPLSSWVTALLAVLDSAALYLSLSPASAPSVPARLCLRSGFQCLSEIAGAMGIDLPDEADPSAGISLTYEEYLHGIAQMLYVDFPKEREPAEAWQDFVGWRVNYEQAAYAVAAALDVVPAMWSGPRRRPVPPIAPLRPPQGRPPR